MILDKSEKFVTSTSQSGWKFEVIAHDLRRCLENENLKPSDYPFNFNSFITTGRFNYKECYLQISRKVLNGIICHPTGVEKTQ